METKPNTPAPVLTEADLAQFTGTDNWYRHGLVRSVLYTDGCKYVAETAGAYWLIDEIALAQKFSRPVRREEFQVWTLKRNQEGSGAKLECGDGNGNRVYVKRIELTDFPLREITFYFENCVICLPAER